MKTPIEVAPWIEPPPFVWFELPEIPDTESRDLICSILFHLIAGLGCFAGWCLTMWLFFSVFKLC
jgi:hypothetical protein